jgi:hypothetical protein
MYNNTTPYRQGRQSSEVGEMMEDKLSGILLPHHTPKGRPLIPPLEAQYTALASGLQVPWNAKALPYPLLRERSALVPDQ